MTGELDTLSLEGFGEVKAIQFSETGWEHFNANEQKGLLNFHIPMDRFRSIVMDDVVEIREDIVVLLLTEKKGFKVYLASFTQSGMPIESFLLHDHYGYLYEKNFRAYSFQKPIHFNERKNTFDFYQLIYGYERIPSIEDPTQDPIYHQSFHQVIVNDEGHIELVYSEETGKKMFSRALEIPVIHEVAFQELSILTVSDAGDPELALWSETFITHGDMESHDSLTIYLPYGAHWEDRFFFLQPSAGQIIIDVSQRHENVPVFPGDGSTCELQNWKRYQSPWKNLYHEEHFFQTISIDPVDQKRFPDYSYKELTAAFEAMCGSIDEMDGMEGLIAVPHPDSVRIAVDRIVLRIRFKGPNGEGSKYLILKVANSC